MAGGAFGAELRAIRVLRGLSVVEAARRAGVSRVSLHRWESGDQEPNGNTLSRLLDALGADPRERARVAADLGPRHASPDLRRSPLGPPAHPGQLLRALREAKRMTQSQLAQAVGVSQVAIGKWEAGRTMPGGETLARALATLGAERLDLREGSLDLYDPIVDPLDARLRIRDLRFTDANPLTPVRLLALEREIWPLAARDPRWMEPLAEALAWRGSFISACGEHTAGLEAAHRAIGIAKAHGCWDAVNHAILTVSEINRTRRPDPARRVRFWMDYAERVRHPLVRADALCHAMHMSQLEGGAKGAADPAFRRRTMPRMAELIHRPETDDLFFFDLPNGPTDSDCLDMQGAIFAMREGDADTLTEIYERAYAADWERRLDDGNPDFVRMYVGRHDATGEPIPARGLEILDARARSARSWMMRVFYHEIGRRAGTYVPSVPRVR